MISLHKSAPRAGKACHLSVAGLIRPLLCVAMLLAGCSDPDSCGNSSGRTYANGDIWTCSDGCNSCTCDHGQVTTTLIYCAGKPGPAAGKLSCRAPDGGVYPHGKRFACENACGPCLCDDGQTVICPDASDAGAP